MLANKIFACLWTILGTVVLTASGVIYAEGHSAKGAVLLLHSGFCFLIACLYVELYFQKKIRELEKLLHELKEN